jgi:putative transposase
MARLARAVFPGIAHHVTQRGNGRQRTFFADADYALYRELLRGHCAEAGVAVWSYVLMPNHVHLILVPGDEDGLRRALAPLHRRYAGHVHARERRTGHFWQGRFGCVAMNPVRAALCKRAPDWPWSSAATLLGLDDDGVTEAEPVRRRIPDLAALLESAEDEERTMRLRRGESVGRPIGSAQWLEALECDRGRTFRRRRPGPKAREELSALSP